MQYRTFLSVCLLFLFAACAKEEARNEQTGLAEADHNTEIAWYQGSIEQAFAEAKESNKPVLLYWGAVWCPPCNELKATVFKQSSFIEKTQFFIPVYLDGDTEEAQRYGEEFSVKGYPTLIAFNAEGVEITRIPGGLELDRYQKILDLVLGKIKPVKMLIGEVQKKQTISVNDCKLLAYYSWGQDNQQALPESGVAELFSSMIEACPEKMQSERSRLFFEYLRAEIRLHDGSEKDGRPLLLTTEVREAMLIQLNEILTTSELILSNVYALRYENGSTIKALTQEKSLERQQLIANWLDALKTINNAQHLSDIERLGHLYAKVSLYQLKQNGELNEIQQQEIKQAIQTARESFDSPYEHSALVNVMRNILVHANMQVFAEQVITEEISNAISPYYFMLELADFAQKEGRSEEALSLYERAYRESALGATRFQWGVYFLQSLTELSPEEDKKILDLSVELIEVLNSTKSGFYNRNVTRLNHMEKVLFNWNKSGMHKQTIETIRAAMQVACDDADKQSPGYNECRDFLMSNNEAA